MRMAEKVEYTIRKSTPDLKGAVRKNRKQFFCLLPARRVWLYVKYSKSFFGGNLAVFYTISNGVPAGGPEDVVIDGETRR
jgi:hypothetical protein